MTLRSLAVTLAALTALAGLAAPASAEVQVREDPRGDVRQLDAGGARSSADIVRVRGEHEGTTLRVALTLADLDGASAPAEVVALARMRTPTGTDFTAAAYREDGRKEVVLYRGLGEDEVRCPGLEARFSSAVEKITVVVPRSCVQRPRWVRFGAVVGAGDRRFFADDARRAGRVDDDGLAKLGTRRLQHD